MKYSIFATTVWWGKWTCSGCCLKLWPAEWEKAIRMSDCLYHYLLWLLQISSAVQVFSLEGNDVTPENIHLWQMVVPCRKLDGLKFTVPYLMLEPGSDWHRYSFSTCFIRKSQTVGKLNLTGLFIEMLLFYSEVHGAMQQMPRSNNQPTAEQRVEKQQNFLN